MNITASEIIPIVLPIIGACLSLLSGLCATAVRILWKLSANVAELNEKMASIVTKLTLSEERAISFNASLREIERRVGIIDVEAKNWSTYDERIRMLESRH